MMNDQARTQRALWQDSNSLATPPYVCDEGHTGVCQVPLMMTDRQFSLMFKAFQI
jgi:hypothetical protein